MFSESLSHLAAPVQELLAPGVGWLLVVVILQHHIVEDGVAAEESIVQDLAPAEALQATSQARWNSLARSRAVADSVDMYLTHTWEFTISSYRPADKWLKDRKGRTLTFDDIGHYHRIALTLSETQEIMVQIDQTIDYRGGWPMT